MDRRPPIVAIAQLPPPVTGLSMVSRRMVDLFCAQELLAGAANIGPPNHKSKAAKILFRSARSLVACWKLCMWRTSGASTLYLPTDSNSGLFINIMITALARVLGYRVYFHHHNFSYIDKHSPAMERLIQSAPRKAHHIFLCDEMAERFSAGYKESWDKAEALAFVLPNGFMVEAHPVSACPTQGVTLGHLSNLSQEKGALRFIKLFRALREDGVDVRARMAGPCQDSVVAHAIAQAARDYPEDFVWLGAVYGEEKLAFYRSIDVFVFPTEYPNEAQPLVLLEAMAHGAVTLATNIGCIGCDHEGAPGAILPKAEFHEGAVQWLKTFCANDELRSTLRSQAKLWFEAHRESSLTALATLSANLGAKSSTACSEPS